jgi:hypothetical protein
MMMKITARKAVNWLCACDLFEITLHHAPVGEVADHVHQL